MQLLIFRSGRGRHRASHGVVEGAILFAREAARPWNYRVMLCLSHEWGLRTFRAYMKFQAVVGLGVFAFEPVP